MHGLSKENFGVQPATTLKVQDVNSTIRSEGRAALWAELSSYTLLISGAGLVNFTVKKEKGSCRWIHYVLRDSDTCFDHYQSYQDHSDLVILPLAASACGLSLAIPCLLTHTGRSI